MKQGLFDISCLHESDTQIVMGVGVIRLDLNRFLQMIDGFARQILFQKDDAEIVFGIR